MTDDNKDRKRRYISAEQRQAARKKRPAHASAVGSHDIEVDPRERRKTKLARRQLRRIIAVFAVLFIVVGAIYAKNIISLTIENKQLEEQQAELEAERDSLMITLENIDREEYIEEQARTLLRLIDPDEIIFVFDDEVTVDDEAEDD